MTVAWPRRLVGALLVCAAPATDAAAQSWSADLYVGNTTYEALATRVESMSLIGNLRREIRRGAAYLSAAAPLGRDMPAWAATGAALRLGPLTATGLTWGAELALDGYAFHDGAADARGVGVSTRLLPLVRYGLPHLAVELAGGRSDHLFSYSDTSGQHDMYELGARAMTGTATRNLTVQTRWLRDDRASYPFAGVQGGIARGPGRVWAALGRWFGSELTGTPWSVGAAWALGQTEVWAAWRANSVEPLLRSASRDGWNVGVSRALGARPAAVLAPRVQPGAVILRLPRRGSAGVAPAVAGDFSGWTPVAMVARGNEWVLEVPLAAGVYRFAFVDAAGEWFVPEGYPGRMSDDMGGHVAVLVVP